MFKPNTLLKVVSILMIILGVLGLIGTALLMAVIPKMGDLPGVNAGMLDMAFSPFSIGLSLVSTLCAIIAGILGVCGKSYKGAVIVMGIYTAALVISAVMGVATTGFTYTTVTGFILPILYWWGLYQSK